MHFDSCSLALSDRLRLLPYVRHERTSTALGLGCSCQGVEPDEHYFVTLSDPRHAESEVRAVVQATWQTTVQVIRELTRDEIESVALQPGKIVYAPKK